MHLLALEQVSELGEDDVVGELLAVEEGLAVSVPADRNVSC